MKFHFVRVGVITPKIKVANTIYNTEQIISGIEDADSKKVEVLVFPELCITGYTCGDLFYSDILLKNAIECLKQIAKSTIGKKMIVFVGLPIMLDGLIYNVTAGVSDGKILGFVPKTYLPNYDEFYEKRYFAPALEQMAYKFIDENKIPFGSNIIFNEIDRENLKISAELCEDLWTVYPPSIRHAISGATLIVNPSASDDTAGKADYRKNMIACHSAKLCAVYAYASAGDGESSTDVVYGGHNVIAENGDILSESKLFNNGLYIADVDIDYIGFIRSKLYNQSFRKENKDYVFVEFSADREKEEINREYKKQPFLPANEKDIDSYAEQILTIQAEGLKKRVEHTNANKLVIGLSGGLDSTLAILVAVRAMQKLGRKTEDIIAVTMPCFGTTSRTFDNTIKLAKSLKTSLVKVDITKSVTRHLKDIKHDLTTLDTTYENAQARERTQVLMDIANMNNGLVIGTGDLSELALGWATYNGDHMSMYGVNCSIPKTLVRYIVTHSANMAHGKLKAVLCDILDTPVSPELLPPKDGDIAQKTEDIVGPYILHDFYLYYFVKCGFSPLKIYYLAKKTFMGQYNEETIKKWLKTFFRRFFSQQFKRSCVPDGIKACNVALSPRGDWRMPSDAEAKIWLNELENI